MYKTCIFLGSGTLGHVSLSSLFLGEVKILSVFTDEDSNEIIEFSKSKNIPYYLRNIRKYNLLNNVTSFECDLMVSVNYKYIIPKNILQKSCNPINFHGSLLPKYRGRTPHIWALINGETEVGVTCHFMTENVDDGPIINQIRIPVADKDTGSSIYDKYIEIYPDFVKKSIELIIQNRVDAKEQVETNASYFGKRTPIMSYVDFHKNAKDIINFVRALNPPYPSAYYFLADGSKIVIYEIIKVHSIEIKTPIGQIVILDDELYVNCNDCLLKIIDYEIEDY